MGIGSEIDGYCRSPQIDNSPGYEADFVPSASAFFLKFKVIDCPSAFILWKVLKKFFVILLILFHSFIDDDLSRFFVKGESDVTEFLLQFELLELLDTDGVNSDT